MKIKIIYFLLAVLYSIISIAEANVGKETGLPIPRFVSLKSSNVNMRNGPGDRYPIKWQYRKNGYPIEIIGEFDNWRKVRDIDGEDGWVHEALISGRRGAIVISLDGSIDNAEEYAVLYRKPNSQSYPIVKLGCGTVVEIQKCKAHWCRAKIKNYTGWIEKKYIWGVYKNEIFD